MTDDAERARRRSLGAPERLDPLPEVNTSRDRVATVPRGAAANAITV
jgi:hypothetical protein